MLLHYVIYEIMFLHFLVSLALRPSPEDAVTLCIYEIMFLRFPQYHWEIIIKLLLRKKDVAI